jgi:Gas vesicle synthesis protein GvpL/GvpF
MRTTSDITRAGSGIERDRTHPVYVYGVIPAEDAAGLPDALGLGERSAVRTVTKGRVAALVSDLPPEHTPGRPEDLEAHRRVLSQAIEHGTVIPMRFGIVMDDDEAVADHLLTRHTTELDEMLRQLDGHVQMSVKAFYAGDALLRDVLASQPELAQESAALAQRPDEEAQAARVRIGELVANAVEARREEVSSALLSQLAPLAADVSVDPPGSERVALSVHLLLHRDHRAALDEEVRELAEALTGVLAFRYVGPLPPFSFADLALDEGTESWG